MKEGTGLLSTRLTLVEGRVGLLAEGSRRRFLFATPILCQPFASACMGDVIKAAVWPISTMIRVYRAVYFCFVAVVKMALCKCTGIYSRLCVAALLNGAC